MSYCGKILNLNFSYFSNFPIKSNFIFYVKKSYTLDKKLFFKNNNKKLCKNFFLLILFLRYLNLKIFKKNNFFIKYNFFIKPNSQNIFNYLRAPYKNKLARNQLYTPRYKFSIQVSVLTPLNFNFSNQFYHLSVLDFLKKNLVGISSNIFYLNKINIKYKSFCKDLWNYNLKKLNINDK